MSAMALLVLGAGLLPMAAASDTGAGADLPKPDVLDLFGHHAPASSETRPALAEQDQEIRRPDKMPRAATRSQNVRWPASEARGWRLWDFFPLLVVLALVGILALILRRFLPGRRLPGNGVLQVAAKTQLSGKHQLVLVRMGRQLLLLGVSPDRIATLSVVDDPQQVAILLGEIESSRPGSAAHEFGSSFAEEAGAYEEDESPPLEVAASGHVRGLLEKVRSLKATKGGI
jgi:flagellar biogenesis protein FliO